MFRELVGPTHVKISRRPVTLRIENSLSSRVDPGGAACAFYSGAFAKLLELYTGHSYRVMHSVCATRGEGRSCEWIVEIAS